MIDSHHHTYGNPQSFIGEEGQLYVEPSPMHYRIPIKLKGISSTLLKDLKPFTKEEILMESKNAYLVIEGKSNNFLLAFDRRDVRFVDEDETLTEKQSGLRLSKEDHDRNSTSKLANQFYDLYIEGRLWSSASAWSFPHSTAFTRNSSPSGPSSADQLIVFHTQKLTQIWEEESLMVGGIRNPYHRVDLVPSKRHVQIYAKSKDLKAEYLIADTDNIVSPDHSFALFETNLRTRWYLPASAITTQSKQGIIQIQPKVGAKMEDYSYYNKMTVCQYKGCARYHHLTLPNGETLENIAKAHPVSFHNFNARGLVTFDAPGNDRLKLIVDGMEIN